MEKKASRLKVGLSALLGYAVMNIIRNILFASVSIVISGIGAKFIRYRLEDIAFFVAYYLGFAAANFIGEKILKTEDALRRYVKTIGLLFIINYAYFIIDYFRVGEGTLFYLVSSLFIGIFLFFSNRKEKEIEE